MSKEIPKLEREKDFERIDNLIRTIESEIIKGNATREKQEEYFEKYNVLSKKYIRDTSFKRQDKGLFKPLELRALISIYQGDSTTADALLREALNLMHGNEDWVSNIAKEWESKVVSVEHIGQDYVTDDEYYFSGRIEGWLFLYALNLVIAPLILFFDLVINYPGAKRIIESSGRYFMYTDFQKILNYSLFYDSVAFILLIITAALFFYKFRLARTLAIATHIFILIGGIIAIIMLNSISSKYNIKIEQGGSILTLGSFIWPLYWVYSKRVRATFIN